MFKKQTNRKQVTWHIVGVDILGIDIPALPRFYLVLICLCLKILSDLSYVLKRVFNDGKRKVYTCIYCARPLTGRHHAIASKNEYTHGVKAGLSLRLAHMELFVSLMHS